MLQALAEGPPRAEAPRGSGETSGYNVGFGILRIRVSKALSITKRITVDPKQMNGVPCIRGLRIPVATVVGMVAEGLTNNEILRSFPDLEAADIRASLLYAAEDA